jgi:hypothetical protein
LEQGIYKNAETKKKKEWNQERMESSQNARCKKYMNGPKKTLRGHRKKPRGTVRIKSTQIRWFSGQSVGM